jgi:hypothetical protein
MFPGDFSASAARWLTIQIWTFNCTAVTRWNEHGRSSNITSERTDREHRLHQLFYGSVASLCKRMMRARHSNGCTRHILWHLFCCVREPPSNGRCLQSHLLATGLYATIPCFFRYLPVIGFLAVIKYLNERGGFPYSSVNVLSYRIFQPLISWLFLSSSGQYISSSAVANIKLVAECNM